jgi:hypothetical protein
MRPFADTATCRSRVFCDVCRDESPVGDRWRRAFADLAIHVPAVCPHGVAGRITPVDITAQERPLAQPVPNHAISVDRFHALWRELHTQTHADAAWLDAFTLRVPCGDCRGHWKWVLWSERPLFGEEWFAWTVRAHNAVNFKLGKPELSIQDARARWLDQAGIDQPSKAG